METFSSFIKKSGKKPLDGIEIKSASLENVMMTWAEFQPGTMLPEHEHPNEQITLIFEGELEMTSAGETRIMTKGDYLLIPPNVRHSARAGSKGAIAVDAWHPIRKDYL